MTSSSNSVEARKPDLLSIIATLVSEVKLSEQCSRFESSKLSGNVEAAELIRHLFPLLIDIYDETSSYRIILKKLPPSLIINFKEVVLCQSDQMLIYWKEKSGKIILITPALSHRHNRHMYTYYYLRKIYIINIQPKHEKKNFT